MLFNVYIWVIVVFLFLLGGGLLLYEILFSKRVDKVRAVLYRRNGNAKQFIGLVGLKEKTHKKLGYYLFNKKYGIKIQSPDTDSFISGNNCKVLNLCKYGTDDWRVMRIMRDSAFYTKVEDFVLEEVEDEETGEVIKVPKLDGKGNSITVTKEIVYNEPFGITQEAQEVWRFNRDFHQAMDEFEKKGQGFWDKYGNLIINGVVILAFMIFVVYLLKANGELQRDIANTFGEKADGYIEAVENPLFVERMMDKFSRGEVEANAPPS